MSGFYIRTYTGKKFFWDTPVTNEYDVRDIAHALSMNCRWTGHVRSFFSVAQHSVLASVLVRAPLRMAALLHDAAEAYVHDTPSPLKWHLKDKGFSAFSDLEKTVECAISKTFDVALVPMHRDVKAVDLRLLVTERRDLMPGTEDAENDSKMERNLPEPYPWRIVDTWSPRVAEQMFLKRYAELHHAI